VPQGQLREFESVAKLNTDSSPSPGGFRALFPERRTRLFWQVRDSPCSLCRARRFLDIFLCRNALLFACHSKDISRRARVADFTLS